MQNFGKYEIVAKIGEGGFGVVYEAFDPRIERRVAVKTCPTDDQTLRQRFLHEARISGNLHHRHIIVVYDYGEEDDVPYLVQEFLTGEDLDRKIARGDDIPFETKVEYLVQVAEGLDFAHRQGVIHRDIKPSNIRILDDGQVKIMDFGIAKLRDSEVALTLPGQTVGTPAYLAPEQIRNVEPDARCDIYAFGLVGYELFTYRKAFPSKNASRVLYQVLNEEPARIHELWPECPPEVERILERCYRKDRDERWGSLGEVVEALRAALAGEPSGDAAAALRSNAPLDGGSATMLTPGGSLEDTRRAIREASAASRTPTPAPTPPPGEPGLAPAPRAALDDLVLGGLGERPRPTDAPPPTESAPAPPVASRLPLVALAVIAALVIGWLGYRWAGTRAVRAEPVAERGVSEGPAATEDGGSEGTAAASEDAGPETGRNPVAPLPASPAPATESARRPVRAEPAPAKTAPPPATTILVVAASWDPTATVRVGDREPVTLDRERSFEIPSDRAVTLAFASGRADYRRREELSVDPAGAARRTVESPIEPPGALTVRAGLGGPRLRVLVDDEEAGFTPLNTRLLPPGTHRVVVAPDDAEDAEAEQRSYTVELAAQEEVVLTFDLRRAEPSIARRPYRN